MGVGGKNSGWETGARQQAAVGAADLQVEVVYNMQELGLVGREGKGGTI